MNATRYLPFVGRLLIGLPFVMSGLGKLAAYAPTTAMIVPRSHERNARAGGFTSSGPLQKGAFS